MLWIALSAAGVALGALLLAPAMRRRAEVAREVQALRAAREAALSQMLRVESSRPRGGDEEGRGERHEAL